MVVTATTVITSVFCEEWLPCNILDTGDHLPGTFAERLSFFPMNARRSLIEQDGEMGPPPSVRAHFSFIEENARSFVNGAHAK